MADDQVDVVLWYLRTARKGTVLAAKAVETRKAEAASWPQRQWKHARQRQCLSHEGSGTHKAEELSWPRRQWKRKAEELSSPQGQWKRKAEAVFYVTYLRLTELVFPFPALRGGVFPEVPLDLFLRTIRAD